MKFYIKLFLQFLPILLFHFRALTAVIVVDEFGKFKSINQAVIFAKDFDTILIRRGVYRESEVFVNKSLHFVGEDNPILDFDNKDCFGFVVKANNVVLKNFKIRNIGLSYLKENSALKFDSCFGVLVENITIENSFFGIYFLCSKNFSIRNCKIFGRKSKIESHSGNGIHLWNCSNAYIENNQVQNHRDGIYFEFVRNSTIKGNICENNLRYGLHFMFSDSCVYIGNMFRRNGAGVAVMYTKNVVMVRNQFEKNWGPSSYGLLLKDIKNGYIGKNKFYNNTIGIYMEGSNQSIFEKNNLFNNGWALKITANCENNIFRYNNFVGNTFEVTTNSSQNMNNFNNNYWSKYSGYDLNKDGIGDIPHIPITLFSIIVQSNSFSMLLLRSFFVEVLEVTEKIFPSIVPKLLVDNSPSLRMFKND